MLSRQARSPVASDGAIGANKVFGRLRQAEKADGVGHLGEAVEPDGADVVVVEGVVRAVVLVDTDAQDLVGLDPERKVDFQIGVT